MNSVDQGVDYYVVDSADQWLAVMEKTKHLSLFLLQNDKLGQW